jgi:ketosteroid isomerase-like protein
VSSTFSPRWRLAGAAVSTSKRSRLADLSITLCHPARVTISGPLNVLEHWSSMQATKQRIDGGTAGRTIRFASATIVLMACLWIPACAEPPAKESDVTAVLESFYSAMKNGDTAAAMALIAPDAVFVESGRLETRSEYETNHLPADIGFEKQVNGKRGPMQVKIQGDTAWVIATTEYDGVFDGGPVNFVSAQLAVLTRAEDIWRIRSIHWSSRRR